VIAAGRLNGATEEQVLRGDHFSKWLGRTTIVAALIAVVVVASGCGSKRSASTTSFEHVYEGDAVAGRRSRSCPERRDPSRVADLRRQCDRDRLFSSGPRLVATVQHVIDGASNITLIRNGKRVATATVVGSDQARDLALLRTSAPIAGHRFALAKTGAAPRRRRLPHLASPLGPAAQLRQGICQWP